MIWFLVFLGLVQTQNYCSILAGDISSLSGSDSEEERQLEPDDNLEERSYHIEGIGRRLPRVFFRSEEGLLLSIYRAVVYGKKVLDIISYFCF